jgi:hypothetical protein
VKATTHGARAVSPGDPFCPCTTSAATNTILRRDGRLDGRAWETCTHPSVADTSVMLCATVKRRDRCNDAPATAHYQQQRKHEQQVIDAPRMCPTPSTKYDQATSPALVAALTVNSGRSGSRRSTWLVPSSTLDAYDHVGHTGRNPFDPHGSRGQSAGTLDAPALDEAAVIEESPRSEICFASAGSRTVTASRASPCAGTFHKDVVAVVPTSRNSR